MSKPGVFVSIETEARVIYLDCMERGWLGEGYISTLASRKAADLAATYRKANSISTLVRKVTKKSSQLSRSRYSET